MEMGTLREIKTKMKADPDWSKTLLRSAKDEILIDVDGDGLADVALMDSIGDGDIDTLALDLTGDGEFNLYFHDSDGNGLPDVVLLDEDGDGILDLAAAGPQVGEAMLLTAYRIMKILDEGDYIAAELAKELDQLNEELLKAQEELEKEPEEKPQE